MKEDHLTTEASSTTPYGLFLMGHGTKSSKGRSQFLDFIDLYRRVKGPSSTGGGLIENAQPEMKRALESFISTSPPRIVIAPVVLLPAGHFKDDGPELIEFARKLDPNIELLYGTEIGLLPEVVALTIERILQAKGLRGDPLSKDLYTSSSELGVLIVARGSTDSDANSDLYKLTKLVADKSGFTLVEPAFVSLSPPSVSEGLDRLRRLGAERFVVVPYFLFHGVLLDRIHQEAKEWVSNQTVEDLYLGSEFGPVHLLCDALETRVHQALGRHRNFPCDLCGYRLAIRENNLRLKSLPTAKP